MTGVWVLLAVLVVVVAVGWWHRRRDGALRVVDNRTGADASASRAAAASPDLPALTAVGFVADAADVTFVQFSSAFCAPCRTTRAVLSSVAAADPGVRHLEVDAESHLDQVRALGILRTPTTLVVDRAGVIRERASGAPRRADVLAAVGRLTGSLSSQLSDAETT